MSPGMWKHAEKAGGRGPNAKAQWLFDSPRQGAANGPFPLPPLPVVPEISFALRVPSHPDSSLGFPPTCLLLCPWPPSVPLSPELPLEDNILGQLQHSPTKYSPMGQPRPFGLPREVVGSSPWRPPLDVPSKPNRSGIPIQNESWGQALLGLRKVQAWPSSSPSRGLLPTASHWGCVTVNKSFSEGGCYPNHKYCLHVA